MPHRRRGRSSRTPRSARDGNPTNQFRDNGDRCSANRSGELRRSRHHGEGRQGQLEGRFGSPAPVSGSEVQSTAVEGCPAPPNDGRAIIVRLDLAAALESSLSGEVVARFTGGNGANKPFFLLGTTQGAACESQSEAKVDFGTLQPGQSGNMAIWLVLANAISPDNPQPTEETLAKEGWEIQAPELLVNEATVYGAPGQPTRATGPRVPACSEGLQYVAIFAGTPDASICE